MATINDDDQLPALSIADASVTEGDTGVRTLVFTVNLSAPSDDFITVQFATADGLALGWE